MADRLSLVTARRTLAVYRGPLLVCLPTFARARRRIITSGSTAYGRRRECPFYLSLSIGRQPNQVVATLAHPGQCGNVSHQSAGRLGTLPISSTLAMDTEVTSAIILRCMGQVDTEMELHGGGGHDRQPNCLADAEQ